MTLPPDDHPGWDKLLGDVLRDDPVTSGFFSQSFTKPPKDQGMTAERLRAIMEELSGQPERPVSLEGRKYDIYNLLIDMGCSFDMVDGETVPAPIAMGTLGVDVIFDDQALIGVITERYADGRASRCYIRTKYEWIVSEQGDIIDRFEARHESRDD